MAIQELSLSNTELTCRQMARCLVAVLLDSRAFGAQLPLPRFAGRLEMMISRNELLLT